MTTGVLITPLGARIACERYGPLGRLLAFGIAGHHAGLANGRDPGERTALSDRLRAELPRLLPAWLDEIELPAQSALPAPAGFRGIRGRTQFQLAFLGRMIFSCLVDADFLDTENFYNRIEKRKVLRGEPQPSLMQLRTQLDGYLGRFKADSPVNQLRAEILSEVRGRAPLAPGLFSLTVPTGGGKTQIGRAHV